MSSAVYSVFRIADCEETFIGAFLTREAAEESIPAFEDSLPPSDGLIRYRIETCPPSDGLDNVYIVVNRDLPIDD